MLQISLEEAAKTEQISTLVKNKNTFRIFPKFLIFIISNWASLFLVCLFVFLFCEKNFNSKIYFGKQKWKFN